MGKKQKLTTITTTEMKMLEQRIEALTAAIEKLTAVLDNPQVGVTLADAKIPELSNVKVAAKEANKPAAKAIEYDDVKGPFVEFIESKGHEAAAALLAKFAVAKLPALPVGQFSNMLAAIREAS